MNQPINQIDPNSASLSLSRWAVIDIETTGLDPLYDDIIDVGFLQFEGTRLIRQYRSLVHTEKKLSYFVQKLTGIKSEMIRQAPHWRGVGPEVMELAGHHLIAHNAEFEKTFLQEHFNSLGPKASPQKEIKENYEDSLPFLSLLFPWQSQLKLESFIVNWDLRQGEAHRGLEDSLDLLKVLLTAVKLSLENRPLRQALNSFFQKYHLQDYWYYKFFNLKNEQIEELAEQIDFDLDKTFAKALAFQREQESPLSSSVPPPHFDLECSSKNIQKILRSEDQIKERIPFYQYRKGQEDLALKTGQSLKNGVHSLVQAPTGTGKTMGYLIASSLFALEKNKQILVATGTKTLQQQATNKDVPQLRQLLSLSESQLKVSELVGSQNHLCELLFRQREEENDLFSSLGSFEEKFTAVFFEMVFFHNQYSDKKNLIRRDKLPYLFKMKYSPFRQKEREIAVDYRSCTGHRCPFRHDCTYMQGLKEAKEAHIIIGNHSLMLTWPRSFSKPEHIIVDEAHRIENEATQAFSLETSQEDLESFSKGLAHQQGLGSLFFLLSQEKDSGKEAHSTISFLREEAQKTHQLLQDHLLLLPDLIEDYFKKRPKYTDQYWNELPMVNKEQPNDNIGVSLFNHFESIQFILKNLEQTLLPYSALFSLENTHSENQVTALTHWETFFSTLCDLSQALETICEQKPSHVHSLKFHENLGYLLLSAPIDIGQILHDQLLAPSRSVIYTSATLGNATGEQGAKGMEWATGYSYLDPSKRFRKGLFLPSEYNYKENTQIHLCEDTLSFHKPEFVETTLKALIPLIRKLEGRTLLLFSARKRFEKAREVLLKEFEGEIPLYCQGMGIQVVEQFKKNNGGILLGMESFGEGIDIPGETLQFIFIDKIPDLRMDLVINERRLFYNAHLGNEFIDYYLSHRTRSLHQKLGRLIRRENDRGGVIIVDSRIQHWKRASKEKLIRLMEPYHLRQTSFQLAIGEVEDFILGAKESPNPPHPNNNREDHLADSHDCLNI